QSGHLCHAGGVAIGFHVGALSGKIAAKRPICAACRGAKQAPIARAGRRSRGRPGWPPSGVPRAAGRKARTALSRGHGSAFNCLPPLEKNVLSSFPEDELAQLTELFSPVEDREEVVSCKVTDLAHEHTRPAGEKDFGFAEGTRVEQRASR